MTDRLTTLLAHAGQPKGLNGEQLASTVVALCDEFARLEALPTANANDVARMDAILVGVEACRDEDRRRRIDTALVAAGGPRGQAVSHVARMAAQHGPTSASPNGGHLRPSAVSAAPAVITAALSASGIPAGSPLTNADDLAHLMSETLERMTRSGPFEPRRQRIASARWEYPEERQLGTDSVENGRRIEAVCNPRAPRFSRSGALVASGGICAPVNVDYSVPVWSTADRPLRDGLPAFQASRGGITFVPPPDIGVPDLQGTASDAGLATTVWTEANDASPTSPATKPVWKVTCGTPTTVTVNAIPTRVEFGNMQSRFAPEQVAANTEQAIGTAAREAELELLSQMYGASRQVKPQQYLGATRDLLSTVDLLREQYLYSHRIPRTASFTVVFPAWAQGLLRADLARELAHDTAGGDRLAVSDAQIDQWFAVRNLNPIWTLDGLKAGTYGEGGSAITNQFFGLLGSSAPEPQWPGESSDGSFMVAFLMYVEGTFQFLDGGRLDLGVVRDSTLDATNDYETFVETFEAIAFRGIEAYQVQSTVTPNGGSAGSVATSGYHE